MSQNPVDQLWKGKKDIPPVLNFPKFQNKEYIDLLRQYAQYINESEFISNDVAATLYTIYKNDENRTKERIVLCLTYLDAPKHFFTNLIAFEFAVDDPTQNRKMITYFSANPGEQEQATFINSKEDFEKEIKNYLQSDNFWNRFKYDYQRYLASLAQ